MCIPMQDECSYSFSKTKHLPVMSHWCNPGNVPYISTTIELQKCGTDNAHSGFYTRAMKQITAILFYLFFAR